MIQRHFAPRVYSPYHVPSILRRGQLGAILAHRRHVLPQIRQHVRRSRARVVKGTIPHAGARSIAQNHRVTTAL